MSKKVFAFDLGKTSIGYCVRDGFNILDAGSIIIDKEHSDNSDNKTRKRAKRTLDAHKAREEFFNNLWISRNLEILDKEDDRFKKEFAKNGDSCIYTSCLLRIALLQGRDLETWQIYKALFNAFQRRGYDVNIPWKNSNKSKDDSDNEARTKVYTQKDGEELIKDDKYKYPCYYDAVRLGLWNEEQPEILNRCIPNDDITKVRTAGLVAPRKLVEKELRCLWENAKKQIPQLRDISVEYFLYGEYGEAYASYTNKKFIRYRGTEKDWTGVLGQKIPRFDNRIIAKCKLLPKRNVCKANTIENVSLVLLMKLKNLRLMDLMGENFVLSPEDINTIYNNWLVKAKVDTDKEKLDTIITSKEISSAIGKKFKDKIDPLKADISGRSSFCRRACQIMKKFILSGALYPQDVDYSEFVDKDSSRNGITYEEINSMLEKIGDANKLFIPDNRYEMQALSSDVREETDIVIGSLTNPIVRNRMQVFRDLMFMLKEKHKFTPDEVIFEFVRDNADNSLFGRVKAQAISANIKAMEEENEQIREQLSGVENKDKKNFYKLKLLRRQGGQCIYSGRAISVNDLSSCEIDHIYPRSRGGNDAIYNKVLCYSIENQKKGDRTPYEWLHNDEKAWFDYIQRLEKLSEKLEPKKNREKIEQKKYRQVKLGQKKFALLTSKPEDCAKLIDSYNGLAETAQIARLAQQVTAFIFGWGLQVEGKERRIYVNNGSSTAAIRRTYRLNSLLGDDTKKNRDNDKHHALDAICISFSRDYKYNKETGKSNIQGLNPIIIKEAIEKVIPYPYTNDKPLKSEMVPDATMYGKKVKDGKVYLTQRIKLSDIKAKEKSIKNILDIDVKNDLLNKLEDNMSESEWQQMLKTYIHPKKKTKVVKVLTIETEGNVDVDTNGRERVGDYVDFGTKGVKNQFKHSKRHKGQILYYNKMGTVKVMPIYANINTQEVKDRLIESGCKIYNKGQVFYSGCLVIVPEKFDGSGKGKEYPAGIYKLRTIKSNGSIKLEDNNGNEVDTNAKYLVNAHFKKCKKRYNYELSYFASHNA